MDQQKIDAYWGQFLAAHSDTPPDTSYVAERFGDSPELADELAALILDGTKTATCSALWEWEYEAEPLPEIGTLTILLNGNDEPICILETTEILYAPITKSMPNSHLKKVKAIAPSIIGAMPIGDFSLDHLPLSTKLQPQTCPSSVNAFESSTAKQFGEYLCLRYITFENDHSHK